MISIVIPVLNEEKALPDCLRSLREQDYRGDFEILIVDNGSTDSSAGLARSLGARVVSSLVAGNVFYARKFGAQEARGDIIIQADADTIYPNDWLTRINRHFTAHPEVVAVAGTFRYREPTRLAGTEYFLRSAVAMMTKTIFGRPFIISGATFAFRREAFLKVGGYDLDAYAPDQYGIVSQLSHAGKIIYDRKLLVQTSSRRRAQKPASLLVREVVTHMSSAIAFLFTGFIRDNILSVKKPVNIQHRKKIITTALSSVLVIAIGIIAYGYFAPTSQVFGKVYYRAKSAEKLVALTFDDGPNEPYTSQILDILATHDIKATFFVTGYNVGVYPETAERILAEGHVVGNHSYSHYANHALTNLGCRDLELGEKVIFETMGIRPHLYRPPHGKKSPWEEQYIKKENMILVNWSAAANDGFDRTPEAMARHILADTKPGGIILLHDGYGNEHGNANADKSLTVATLEIIIKELQTQGYRFVTVPQLFGVAAYNSPG